METINVSFAFPEAVRTSYFKRNVKSSMAIAAAWSVEAVVKADGHSDKEGAEHIRQNQRFFRIGIVPGVLHKDHEDRGEWKQYH